MDGEWAGEENRVNSEYVLTTQMKVLHGDITEMKGTLSRLTDAITKLALVEERQTRSAEALERAFVTIEKMSDRIGALERQLPMLMNQAGRASGWVDKVMWAAVSGSAVYMLKAMGVL
jgi:hypothetical protein